MSIWLIKHKSFVSCWKDTQISCILERVILDHWLVCLNLILVNVLYQIKFPLMGVYRKHVLVLLVIPTHIITLKIGLVRICFLINFILFVVKRFVFLFINCSLLYNILLFQNVILLINQLLLLNKSLMHILRTI